MRQNRWLKDEAVEFLANDDVPADPIGDLVTQKNKLSVWEVAEDRSNLERIVRAVAIGREKIADMGYVVFDSSLLSEANIHIIANEGNSPDKQANAWHRDLALSGNKLIALVKAILQHGESGTVLRFRLAQLVEEGIRNGQIPEKLRSKL